MKRILTLVLSLVLPFAMRAERVDLTTASNMAKTVMPDSELVFLPIESFENLYVFNSEHGFVVVAADNCARPILAYSDDFPFRVENMPENIRSWMQSLNDEIQNAIDQRMVPTEEIRREWDLLSQGNMPEPKNRAKVLPLVKTHWDQYHPYNILCPDDSYTGCVATAMAQIMKYWEWPNKGTGSHSYEHNTYGTLSANFGNTTYDWDNMVDQVFSDSPDAQQIAVATLMYHCGVSVDMDYAPDGSTALLQLTPLYSYFDYHRTDMQIQNADDYSYDSWVSLIKTELDAGRPMLYRGAEEVVGHAFVCDGYDANDYLHFNWGWSGYCDGYYAYGALNPGAGGSGGGAGSYNNHNYLISGIHPNTPPVSAPGNFSASSTDRTVSLQWSAVTGANHYKVYRDGFVINTNVSGTSYTDSNVIYGRHTYYVKAVKDNGVCSLRSEELTLDVTYPGPVPVNLTANVQNHDVHLSWTAPASENAQLKYGDGEAASSAYGNNNGLGFCWGQRFTPEQLSSYAGMAITSVEVYLNSVTNYTLYVYKEVNGETETLLAQPFSNTASGWHTVHLATPLPIDYEHNMIVAVYNETVQYVAPFMENYEGSGNARLLLWDGYWYEIGSAISWLFKTNITDGTYTYSIYRDDQQIASNLSQTNYNDTGLSDGFYQYTVRTQYYGELSDPSNVGLAIVGSATYVLMSVTVTNPECNGGDGTVSVEVSGGFRPLTFTLGNQSVTISEGQYTFQEVAAGTYTLMIKDHQGYELNAIITVNEPESLSTGAIRSGSESMIVGGTCSPILSVQDATSGQSGLTYRWKKNGNVISDSNTAQYTPTNLQPGSYNFTREVMDDCTDWTPSSGTWRVVVSQNAVDENDTRLLEVYPNPTNDKVTVRLENMKSITVYTVTGVEVASMEVNDDQVEVDLTNVQPGVYLLRIETVDGASCFTRIAKR